jgi:Rrf2 family protein
VLTQKARYALHAMLFLAAKGESATVVEIATAQAIPRKFLEAVMGALKSHDLVIGRRGPQGGYLLSRPATAITFADVLRAIDGPLALAPCASQTAYRPCADCVSVETCKIRPALLAVRDTTSLLLEGITLAEATAPGRVSARVSFL